MLTGLGMGLTFVPLSLVALAKVPHKDTGAAASLLNTGQQVGGAIGLAVLGTVAWSAVASNTRSAVAAAQPRARLRVRARVPGGGGDRDPRGDHRAGDDPGQEVGPGRHRPDGGPNRLSRGGRDVPLATPAAHPSFMRGHCSGRWRDGPVASLRTACPSASCAWTATRTSPPPTAVMPSGPSRCGTKSPDPARCKPHHKADRTATAACSPSIATTGPARDAGRSGHARRGGSVPSRVQSG
jgi:hypothetical protein